MLENRNGRLEASKDVCLLHLILVFDTLTLCLKQLSPME